MRLPQVVGVSQQKFVEGIASKVGVCGMRGAGRAKLGGTNVGLAAGQEYAVAALDHFHHLGWRLVKWNAHGLASSQFDSVFVLQNRPLRIFAIGGVRHGDGNARRQAG